MNSFLKQNRLFFNLLKFIGFFPFTIDNQNTLVIRQSDLYLSSTQPVVLSVSMIVVNIRLSGVAYRWDVDSYCRFSIYSLTCLWLNFIIYTNWSRRSIHAQLLNAIGKLKALEPNQSNNWYLWTHTTVMFVHMLVVVMTYVWFMAWYPALWTVQLIYFYYIIMYQIYVTECCQAVQSSFDYLYEIGQRDIFVDNDLSMVIEEYDRIKECVSLLGRTFGLQIMYFIGSNTLALVYFSLRSCIILSFITFDGNVILLMAIYFVSISPLVFYLTKMVQSFDNLSGLKEIAVSVLGRVEQNHVMGEVRFFCTY